MSILAIITARGGSKRIPRKNIRDFCGKPIIAYSIEAALNSDIFDEVMVSTDSKEIKTLAEQYGAKVPFMRSDATSNDFATTADVLKEVIRSYRETGREFDFIACIYPTAPFVSMDSLREAWRNLSNSDADAIATVVKFSFPPQRAFVIHDNLVSYQYPEYKLSRSQDLEPVYHDCGQFYICRTNEFLRHESLIVPRTMPYILPEEEVQDIDTMSDWEIAEAKYMAIQKRRENASFT